MELETASHGDLKEEVHVQTGEATLQNSGYGSLYQLPPSKRLCSTDAQADDCQFAESSPDVIAKDILLHAQLVLCDGHCVVDGQRRDAKHLPMGDIFIEAL